MTVITRPRRTAPAHIYRLPIVRELPPKAPGPAIDLSW